jgi:hypothetical protein
MNDSFGGSGSRPRAGGMNSLQVSRRGLLGGALAASSLFAAGVPLQACAAVRDRTPTGSFVRENPWHGRLNVQVSRGGHWRKAQWRLKRLGQGTALIMSGASA